MGADASPFLFDFALYRETVAPAFRRLLLDGYVEPWLSDIYRAYLQHYEIAEQYAYDLGRFGGVDLLLIWTPN
jgi:hypothetical protein